MLCDSHDMDQSSASQRIPASFRLAGRAWGRRVQEEIFCRSPFLAQPGRFAGEERRNCRLGVMPGQVSRGQSLPPLPESSCTSVRQGAQSQTVTGIISRDDAGREHDVIVYSSDYFLL